MTSTIHADKIMNSSGDQDSGVDLLVNDQVKIKTANTDRITVTDSAASMGDNFKLRLGTGNDLNVYHDGSNSYIEETGTGDTHIVSNHIRLRADNINLSNNANTIDGLLMNSSGIITTPKRPSFSARKNRASGGAVGYQGDPLVFDTENFDIGGNYNTSNGKFTTPIAGVYQFSFVGFGCSSAGGVLPATSSMYIQMERDGTIFGSSSYAYSSAANTYPNMSFTIIQQLGAGEEITVHVYNQYVYADTSHNFDPLFMGYLIG